MRTKGRRRIAVLGFSTGGTFVAAMLALIGLSAMPAAAQSPLAQQDPASAQPKIPQKMPDLTVPVTTSQNSSRENRVRRTTGAKRHMHASRRVSLPSRSEPLDRPALANVELVEPLPHPPQPPHVTVPVPGYPLDDFITYFTAPPPPIVCRPAPRDRFKPDPRLVDERPVLCIADNP